MKLLRTSAALIVLGMIATASVGQESAPPAQAPAKPAAAPAPPTAPVTPPAADGEAAPASPATGVVRDDEFIPTQEVQADEEVTFPVDI